MNESTRLKYLYTIIDQSPNLPKARNAQLLIEDIKLQLGSDYERAVGYNPFDDDPTISPVTVAETLEGYYAETSS